MKMFKAEQIDAFLKFLQMKNKFSELEELKTHLKNTKSKYEQKK